MIDSIKNRMEREEGFTLIELLVVILIIGILAAIAIPSFLNQREKGQDACAKSQARTMSTAMETLYTDNNSYLNASMSSLNTIETAVTGGGACGTGTTAVVGGSASGTTGTCTGNPTATDYCVSQSSASTRSFAVVKTAAGTLRLCGATTGGGCSVASATANGW